MFRPAERNMTYKKETYHAAAGYLGIERWN
jgi:hypothetical protein